MVTKNGMAVKRNKSEKHCRIYGYNSVHKMSSPCSADNEEQLSQMHFMCMFADLVNIHREEKRKNESNNRDQSQKQNDKEPKVEPHVLEQYNKVKDIALQRFKNEKEMLQSFGALFTNNSSFDSQYLENPTSGCDGRSFHHPSGDRYGARMFDVGEKSDEDGAKCWNKGGDSFDVDLIASQLQNKIFFGQAPYAEPHDATDTSIYVDNNSKSSTKKLKKSVNDAPQINTKAKAKLVATPKDKEVQGTNNSKSASKVDANSKGNSRPEKEEYEPEEDDGNLDPEALKRKMKNFKKNEKRREKKEKALREVREQEEELKRIKQAELKAKQDQEDAVKKCMEETRLFFEAEDKKRSQLFEAIQKGDLDLVKELLSKGQLAPTEREFIKRVPCSNSNPLNSHPNTNVEVTQSGAGLLHMCCTEAFTYADQELVHKKLMIADFLLSLKNPSVDIRILDSNGFNVLNYAVYVQDIGMLQLLLQVKTRENNDHKLHLDVNDKCPSTGWAPLHYAAVYANIDMCKLLLDAGASINNRIIAATEKITLDTTTTKSTIFLHGSTNAKNVIGVNPYELIQYLFQCHSDNRISLSDEEILPLTAVMDEFAIVLKEAELAKQNKDKEKQQRTCEVTTENEKLVEKNRLDAELLEKKQKLLKERRERELKMEAEEEALRKTVKSNVSKVLSGAIPVDGSGGPVSKKKKNKTTETASGSNSQSTNANSACNNNTNPGTNSTASEEQRRINRAWNAKAGGEFKKVSTLCGDNGVNVLPAVVYFFSLVRNVSIYRLRWTEKRRSWANHHPQHHHKFNFKRSCLKIHLLSCRRLIPHRCIKVRLVLVLETQCSLITQTSILGYPILHPVHLIQLRDKCKKV